MSSPFGQVMKAVVLILATAAVLLAVIGGFKSYSAVPYWDMWNGYLGFFAQVQEGNFSAWWAQHNEHRIVLARLLFWLDITFFSGLGIFLLVVNYILLASIFMVFYVFLSRQAKEQQSESSTALFGLLLLGWLFSWSQHENLTWGFQSQFFLAQLLPLSALLCQAISSKPALVSRRYFIAAACLGVLSLGTMANGLLALPLMVLLSLLLRSGWKRSLTLAVLSVLGIAGYLHGYVSPPAHGSLSQALLENPLGVLAYACLYIGGPFYYLGGGEVWAKYLVIGAGAFLMLAAAIIAITELFKPNRSAVRLALLTFLLYVGGSAVATAGGRLTLGLGQALSSRYMTPSLMAWAALLILLAPQLERLYRRKAVLVLLLIVSLLSVVVWRQTPALQDRTPQLFERKVAALAVELGIRDEQRLGLVFPFSDFLLDFSRQYRHTNWSFFGVEPIRDAYERIGSQAQSIPSNTCMGNVDESSLIPGESRFVRVRGWMLNGSGSNAPASINILNEQGAIVGFALAGAPRPDVQAAVPTAADNSGFAGYVLSETLGKPLHFAGSNIDCKLTFTAPPFPFSIRETSPEMASVSVSQPQVLSPSGWKGSDSWQSQLDGLHVLGSWVTSDADTGAIEIKMKRGDSLLFRTGPVADRQTMRINQLEETSFRMPVSIAWSLLQFGGATLPDEFTVTFTDDGDGWGEWSAVALKPHLD